MKKDYATALPASYVFFFLFFKPVLGCTTSGVGLTLYALGSWQVTAHQACFLRRCREKQAHSAIRKAVRHLGKG
jgi:hypothetical protein